MKGGINAAQPSEKNKVVDRKQVVSGDKFRFVLTYLILYVGCPVAHDDVCTCALKAALGVSEIVELACESGLLLPLSIRGSGALTLQLSVFFLDSNRRIQMFDIELHQHDGG